MEQVALAYNRAFKFGKAGKGSEMRSVIEEFGLDVTKPQSAGFGKKKFKTNGGDGVHETMLHVAAASCDVLTVRYLIEKGKLWFTYELLYNADQTNNYSQ
jgi:hypothetical protein